MFHKSPEVKKLVEESGNNILYSVIYYPRSNPIEKSITYVKEKNYKNYFIHTFNTEWMKTDIKLVREHLNAIKIDSSDSTTFNQIVNLT